LIRYELEEVWMPKSAIEDYEFDLINGAECITAIELSEWLAETKGLV